MAVLDKQIQNKIDDLSNLSYELYEKGEKNKSYEAMEQAYNSYPQPIENWNESFNTCKYALDDLLRDNEMQKVEIWFERMHKIQENLGLWNGIFEFYAAKVYFELKDYKLARKNFEQSIEIGKGYRYFEDEDPKYLDFYKNPEKYIK